MRLSGSDRPAEWRTEDASLEHTEQFFRRNHRSNFMIALLPIERHLSFGDRLLLLLYNIFRFQQNCKEKLPFSNQAASSTRHDLLYL
ncbi:hypothetical protein M378DRAFT_163555, partial [Amanita muscaria Koide BX008]